MIEKLHFIKTSKKEQFIMFNDLHKIRLKRRIIFSTAYHKYRIDFFSYFLIFHIYTKLFFYCLLVFNSIFMQNMFIIIILMWIFFWIVVAKYHSLQMIVTSMIFISSRVTSWIKMKSEIPQHKEEKMNYDSF